MHNAIDRRIITTPVGGSKGRALTDEDLLRLKLWYGVGSILSAERRKRLFDTIDENPDAETVRADDYLMSTSHGHATCRTSRRASRGADRLIESVKGVLGGDRVGLSRRFHLRDNARDFRRLYVGEEVHAGLVIIVPQVLPLLQRELFGLVLQDLADAHDMVNELIELAAWNALKPSNSPVFQA